MSLVRALGDVKASRRGLDPCVVRREGDYSIQQHDEPLRWTARHWKKSQVTWPTSTRLCATEPGSLRSRGWRIARVLVLLQPFRVPTEGGCSKAAMDGPDGVGKTTRSAERELPLSTTQGQGPGATVVGTRDQGPWQSQKVGEPLQTGIHDGACPVAFRRRRSGKMGKLSVALTRSIADHHRHCPR